MMPTKAECLEAEMAENDLIFNPEGDFQDHGYREAKHKYAKYAGTVAPGEVPSIEFGVIYGKTPEQILGNVLGRGATSEEIKFFKDSGQHRGQGKWVTKYGQF